MSETKYLVAARKYRPRVFDDVVAQRHVTETLRNAIRMDRLGHAYLFSGPRGVGKTTVARILAKAINCETSLDERNNAEPCDKCASCKTFSEGRSMNVIEIDAASNNKVDDVRELRDTVRVPPQGAKKKVYIVDEVHMLSTSAFNAFLKTLEEPPPYALFIFATTEPQKVIPTILSRCQRFDFKRIPVAEIVDRLQQIAEEENITVDEASLMLIAQKGDGALRDALSVFDQSVSLCGTDITYADLARALRVVDHDLFFKATDSIRDGDSAGILNLVSHLLSEGYDLQEFMAGLAGHLRNLLVSVSTQSTDLIEATSTVRKQYEEHSSQFSEVQLLRLLMILAQTEESLSRNSQPRLAAELGMLKMAAANNAVDLRQALKRLNTLEKVIAKQPTTSTAESSGTVETEPATGEDVTEPEPVPVPKKVDKPAAQASDNDSAELSTPRPIKKRASKPTTPVPASEPAPESTEAPAAPRQTGPGLFGPPALSKKSGPRNSNIESGSVEGSLAISVKAPSRLPDSIEEIWLKYVSTVKSLRIHVGSLLQHGAPVDVKGSAVVVAIPDDFHKRLLDNQHEFLLKHLNAASEIQYKKIEFIIRKIAQAEGDETRKSEFDPYEYMKRKRQESPIVKSIFEDFGGELVW
ncbi:MAG: DNA polymerase III subunit gamma/tau [Rhodothermales bacterium]|nr:DNA polymerase III subunit gamma/tau [Rhodothermales bacterium]